MDRKVVPLSVVDTEPTPPEKELPPLAVDAIHKYFTNSEEMMMIPTDIVESFSIVMETADGYIVAGSTNDHDELISLLERGKLALVFRELFGVS